PGNVNKALRRAGEGKHDFWDIYPFLLPETRGYVPAFIAANYIMTYHKDHNISPALARRPLITDTIHVRRRVHFEQISQVMGIPMAELRSLNPQFRKDIIPGDIRPYSLVLPSLQVYAYIANEDSILNHDAAKYARRGIVQPASAGTHGRDARGEYFDEEVTKYHTVRQNETLSSIAKKYGVTVSSIRKANKLGSKTKRVKVGRKLKVTTIQRRYKPQPVELPETQSTAADSIAVPVTLPDSVPVETAAPVSTPDTTAAGNVAAAFSAKDKTVQETTPAPAAASPAKETVKQKTPTPAPAKPRTHKVARGENLSKIAKRYGVTVAAIKKANNMAGDNIKAGQRIKIP
ncbi:MAG: LysM peptidoglycan-binding domain-containing protein, partial [Muribaculaceae bacterium]|nr:LysM peptidoglycan-binding domain-containing protein [Muribaculaceae bacterium]